MNDIELAKEADRVVAKVGEGPVSEPPELISWRQGGKAGKHDAIPRDLARLIARAKRRQELDEAENLRQAQDGILAACDEIKDILLSKNRKYGNSALEPVGVRAACDDTEDAELDLIGYLILKRVARKREPKDDRR